MLLFVFKRILYITLAIPLIVLFAYGLFSLSPLDPVERLIDQGEYQLEKQAQRKSYIETAKLTGLDLPSFYFAINTSNYQKDFYSIVFPDEKKFFKKLLNQQYNYKDIRSLYEKLLALRNKEFQSDEVKRFLESFEYSKTSNTFLTQIIALQKDVPLFQNEINKEYQSLISSRKPSSRWFPKWMWLGTNNQYHHWLKKTFTMDFGNSMRDGKPVFEKLWGALFLTLFMIFLGILLAYPFGIWIGKRMAMNKESKLFDFLERVFFLIRSIPLFWFATLMLIFFTTPEYGKIFHIFPTVSTYGFNSNNGFFHNLYVNGSQLILPMICIAIYHLGFLSRQVKTLIIRESESPYVNTARMKGLNKNKVLNHQFKNTIPQIITMLSAGISSGLSGSVVIEYIFNIPGMGRLILDSIRNADWPMLMLLIVFIYIIISLIFSLSDLLYMKSDPRIRLQNES